MSRRASCWWCVSRRRGAGPGDGCPRAGRRTRIVLVVALAAAGCAGLATVAEASLLRVPSAVATVGAALAAAASGDTVSVAAGTYPCSAELRSGVTLLGEGLAGAVTLDAQGAGPVLRLTDAGSGTRVHNLVLRGGVGSQTGSLTEGGGIFAVGSSPLLSHVRITGCSATVGGGAYFEDGAPVLHGCTLDGNNADFGAGLALNGAAAQIDTCTLGSNTALRDGGGLMCLNGASAAVFLSSLGSNQASGNGGGAAFLSSTGNLLTCTLQANGASGDGGGLYCAQGSTLALSHEVFRANHAARGGGLYLGCAAPAGRPWIGAAPERARGAMDACSMTEITNSTLVENTASVAGGGLAINDGAEVRMVNNIVALSPAGGGVACLDLRSAIDARCNDVWRNSPEDWGAGCTVPDHPEFGNLHVNPLFCDPVNGQYTLCANSSLANMSDCFTQAIGAFGVACPPCATAVRPLTWGRLRRIYAGEPAPAPERSSTRPRKEGSRAR